MEQGQEQTEAHGVASRVYRAKSYLVGEVKARAKARERDRPSLCSGAIEELGEAAASCLSRREADGKLAW